MALVSAFSTPMEGDFVALSQRFSSKSIGKLLNLSNVPISNRYTTVETGGLFYWQATEPDSERLAQQRQLTAFCCALQTQLHLQIEKQTPLMFQGLWVWGELCGQNGKLSFTGENGGQQYHRSHRSGLWLNINDQTCHYHDKHQVQVSIIDHQWSCFLDRPRELPGRRERTLFTQQLDNALSLLRNYASEYYRWVSNILKHIVIIKPESDEVTESTSSPYIPGTIEMSAPATTLQTVGMLVHECSHLYFHFVEHNLPLLSTDAPMFFSPLKEAKRPFDRLLLGYHAFGNMLLALEQIRPHLAHSELGELDFECRQINDTMQVLDGPLSKYFNRYLSAAGRDIYLPLKRRLLAVGY